MEHNLQSMTFPGLLNYNRENFLKNNALSFYGSEFMNYSQMHKAIQSLQLKLQQKGIKKGDKVALFAANSPQWAVSYFAVVSMGAIIVPMLTDLQENEVENILSHSEASLLLVSKRLSGKVYQEKHADLKHIVLIDELFDDASQDAFEVKAYNLSVADEEDTAAILYTSGSTGTPKAVMLSHKNLITNTIQGYNVQPVSTEDRFLSILPLAHTYENTLGLLLPVLNGSSITYLKKPPTASVLLPAMKKTQPTVMLTVPMVIEKVVRKQVFSKFENGKKLSRLVYSFLPARKIINYFAGKKLKKAFGGHLKFFGVGGAKLDAKVERFLKDARFPYAIGYGLTETSPLTAGSSPQNTKLKTIGPVVDGTEIKISDGTDGSTLGEILIKGPNVMQGYYKNEQLTNEVFTSDGYFRSGDLGGFDSKGNLYLNGRSKNMILGANGENIYPEDIESVINNFAFVLESIVIEQKGKLVALVHFNRDEIEQKLKNFRDDVHDNVERKIDELSEELQQFVNKRVSRYARVHAIVVQHREFEKTATKKIKRFLYA